MEPEETNREKPNSSVGSPRRGDASKIGNAGVGDRLKTSPREPDLSKPNIEINRDELLELDYSEVLPIKINKELYLRLVKVGVLLKEDIEGG